MALQLSVIQTGGKLRVFAGNNGNLVAIIDHIVLTIQTNSWSWLIFKYEDDFYFGGRVGTGWSGLMFEINYSSGPAQAYAKAHYWEVDQAASSSTINVS
jgi:hypothetical protein